ncbi:MAG: hypothetical protein ACOC7T_00590 [Planctomycetota bacterium]
MKGSTPWWKKVGRGAAALGVLLLLAGAAGPHAAGFFPARRFAGLLLPLGGLLTAAGLALNLGDLLRFLRRSRTSAGLNFALTVGLALLLAASLCYISTRRYARMDWRTPARGPLHPLTRRILQSVDRPVEAVIFYRTLQFPDERKWKRALDLAVGRLRDFSALNPHIRVKELNWSVEQARRRRLAGRLDLEALDLEKVPELCVIFFAGQRQTLVPLQAVIRPDPEAPGQNRFYGQAAFAGALAELTLGERAATRARTTIGPSQMQFIQMSPGQITAVRYIFLAGVPGFFVLLGATVWLVRRR